MEILIYFEMAQNGAGRVNVANNPDEDCFKTMNNKLFGGQLKRLGEKVMLEDPSLKGSSGSGISLVNDSREYRIDDKGCHDEQVSERKRKQFGSWIDYAKKQLEKDPQTKTKLGVSCANAKKEVKAFYDYIKPGAGETPRGSVAPNTSI